MKYFKYKNTDKTHNSALKAQYKALSEGEKRIVRKEKMWRRILNILIYLFYFAFMVAVVWSLKLVPTPKELFFRILSTIGKIIIAFFLSILGGFLALIITTPVQRKLESYKIPALKKDIFRKACAHLREYYGLKEPFILTKCFDSTDRKFRDHDVCIFIVDSELRITTDLINGFLYGERDLGCYTFKADEITLTKQHHKDRLAIELKSGDTVFLLGYRAMGYIRSNLLNGCQ